VTKIVTFFIVFMLGRLIAASAHRASTSRMISIRGVKNIVNSKQEKLNAPKPAQSEIPNDAPTPAQVEIPNDAPKPTQLEIPNDAPKPTLERLVIGFTCKVCSTRQFKSMSRVAYTKGVVFIKCDGCKNTHLIADHLGWYEHNKPAGTIEDILAKKGESVQKILMEDGTLELIKSN
jgi:hypothetical protein